MRKIVTVALILSGLVARANAEVVEGLIPAIIRASSGTIKNFYCSTMTVTGSSVSINGVGYKFPNADGVSDQVLSTNGNKILSWKTSAGGGGSSSLAIQQNSVQVSSPTASINFLTPLVATLTGAATSQISIDASSVTMRGSAVNVANKLLLLDGSALVPSAQVPTNLSAYIWNSSSNQSATFNVSSGTVQGNQNFWIQGTGSSGGTGNSRILHAFDGLPLNGGFGPQVQNGYLYMQANRDGGTPASFNLIASTGAFTDSGSPRSSISLSPGTSGSGSIFFYTTSRGAADFTIDKGTAALHAQNSLSFFDAASANYVILRASASLAASNAYVLPPSSGTIGQAWLTDGKNNLYMGNLKVANIDAAALSDGCLNTTSGVIASQACGGGGGGGTTIWAQKDGAALDNAVSTINVITAGTALTATSSPSGKLNISMNNNLPGGSTSYIQNTNTLQSATTAYPDFLYNGSSASLKGVTLNDLTASLPVQTDANNKLVSSAINLSGSQITSTLGPTHGGTGLATFTQGDMLYSDASNSLAKLAKDTNSTRYLSNTGTSNSPAWAQVNLSNGVTGSLPAASIAAGSLGSSVIASSIAVSGVTAGTYGSATQVSSFTVGGDGRITGAANITISLTNSNLQSGTYSNVTVPAANVAAGSLGSSVIASSIAVASVGIAQHSATGSPSASTFLRGDNTWAAPAGSGDAVLAATQTFSGADTFLSSVTFSGPLISSGSVGTAGQVLTSNGPGIAPKWATASGGSSGFSYTFNAMQARSTDTANACAISGSTNSLVDTLLCDDTADEGMIWSTTLTPYNSGTLTAAIYFSMVSATSGNVVNDVYVACITDGDSQDIDTKAFAAANSATTAVPGTAGYLKVATITLTNNDSCAASDLMAIRIRRNGSSGSDTASGDQEIRKVRIYE